MRKSLQQQGRNAFWLLGLVAILLGCATAWSILRFRADSNLVEHAHEVQTALSEVSGDLTQAESAVRAFLVTGRQSYLEEFGSDRTEAINSSEQLRRLVSDNPEQLARIEVFRTAVARRLAGLAEIAGDRLGGATTDEITRKRGMEARQVIAQLKVLSEEAKAGEVRVLKDRQSKRAWTEIALFSLCGVGTLVSISLLWIGLRSMKIYEDTRDQAERALEKVNAELEERVLERTAKISEANAELRHSQAELSNLAATLKRSNIELENFAYAATHDLQEPLRTITSFAQLIQRRAAATLPPEGNEYLQTIIGASIRMSELIQGLLDYSRVSRGTIDKIERVDLRELLELVKSNLASQIRDAGAELTAGPLPSLTGNRLNLFRLLQNLIGNSLKYQSPGRNAKIDILAQLEHEFWHIQIQDNGIGFEPEYSELIFGLFKRLDRNYPGAGVGLSLCETIVERSGGTIWAEGKLGSGATFHFTWPVDKAAPSA